MTTKELLEKVIQRLEINWRLSTMTEMRKEAKALDAALVKFLEKSDEALITADPLYTDLVSLIGSSKAESPILKKTIKELGVTGKTAPDRKKIAFHAVSKGIASDLVKELDKSPSDLVKEQFFGLARLQPDKIEGEVREFLSGKGKAVVVAKAAGFNVMYQPKKGKKEAPIDLDATTSNAMSKLRPYIDSLRDV